MHLLEQISSLEDKIGQPSLFKRLQGNSRRNLSLGPKNNGRYICQESSWPF